MHRLWASVRPVLLLGVAIVVTVGAIYNVNRPSRGRGTVVAGGANPFTTDGLLVSTRDGLDVCIDLYNGAQLDSSTAVSAVQSAVEALQSNPAWDRAGYATRDPRIVFGCPYQPIVMDSSVRRTGSTIQNIPRRQVTSPSEFRLLVFVLRDVDIARVFGSLDPAFRTQAEETYCIDNPDGSGRSCEAITLGTYLTQSEFSNPTVLTAAITQSLGLTAAFPSSRPVPPPGLIISQGTPLPSPTTEPTLFPSPSPLAQPPSRQPSVGR